MFNKFFKSPVITAVLYSGIVILLTITAAVYNFINGTMGPISAPFAVVLMILSVVITLLPAIALRLYSFKIFRKVKPEWENVTDALFFLVESAFFALTVLLYMGSMGGTVVAGVGLLLISIINIVFVLVWAIVAGGMKLWSDNYDEQVIVLET